MKFDFEFMLDAGGHRSQVFAWSLELDAATALALATGLAVAFIIVAVGLARSE